MSVGFFQPYGGAFGGYYTPSLEVLRLDDDVVNVVSLVSEGDVLLRHTVDDGEIEVRSGVMVMQGGLETAVYLSLFGGNEDDPGGSDKTHSWWGNAGETQSVFHVRSRLQYLLQTLPPTSSNLTRFEDAAKFDLNWMITEGAASAITVFASVVNINAVKIAVQVVAEGQPSEFVYVENWKARA